MSVDYWTRIGQQPGASAPVITPSLYVTYRSNGKDDVAYTYDPSAHTFTEVNDSMVSLSLTGGFNFAVNGTVCFRILTGGITYANTFSEFSSATSGRYMAFFVRRLKGPTLLAVCSESGVFHVPRIVEVSPFSFSADTDTFKFSVGGTPCAEIGTFGLRALSIAEPIPS